MADYTRSVLEHYNLQNPYPVEWPAELDDTDEEEELKKNPSIRRSKSRYSALERSVSDRKSLVPGSQRTGDGRANLVQKDEPDPLGGRDSVVSILRKRGLPVEDNTKLRNKFLLSSTTFSPALFLSQTHSDASTQSLLQGLDFLSRSIDQKSASLKVLVESNFDRFVRAKATIDNVYSQMRNQGSPAVGLQTHSRQTSRSSGHFRNFSGGGQPKITPTKNALTKESEFGVQGIKLPLLEATQKAEDVWGPALGGKEREVGLKAVMEAVNKDQALYEIGANIHRAITQRDYEAITEQYRLARGCSSDAQSLAERAINSRKPLSDEQVHRILATGRMWTEVEQQIWSFKKDIWRRLSTLHTALPLPGASQAEEHMELIGVLLELGVNDNPIWVWLCSRYEHLKNKINAMSERSKVEIEIARRRLANGEKPSPQTRASYLRSAGKESPKSALDTDQTIELWEMTHNFLSRLLSLNSGLLGEIIDFWDSLQAFIDGHKQKALPAGFQGESRKHHQLTSDGIGHLLDGVIELVGLVREAVFSLFADAPIEDISMLFSPLPPNSPATPGSSVLSPTDSRFKIDPRMVPPPSPRRGEPWEEFAFWPPHSNSLSAVHYLSKFLVLVGNAANEMAAIRPVGLGTSTFEKIKALVGGTRERCVRAVCAAWATDAEACKNLEDWTRSPENRDQTKMPMHFMAFSSSVLTGMQKILYVSEAMTKAGSGDVVTPPPAKLLQLVRTQFVTSIYKALSGMVENAEKPIKTDEDDWIMVTEAMASANLDHPSATLAADAIDASSRNVRMLLTLSNLKALRTDLVPQLIALFESSFSVKLTEESKTIRDVLGQIDSRLFQSYTRPTIINLTTTIKQGIAAPDWIPSTERPNQVRPYVYTTMLSLVLVHTEVSTTTSAATALTSEVLSYMLEAVSQALLDAFKERPKYSLAALMQATLDTEFMAQTMSQYATDKASNIQSQIYLELDRRTNNDARARLQSELGEMRIALKRLREGTRSEFACFKKDRERGRRG